MTARKALLHTAEQGAFPGYYRFWLSIDGPLSRAIDKSKGLTGNSAREISNAYSVARTFGGTCEGKWDCIASHINGLANKWTKNRRLNAAFCIETAKDIQGDLGGCSPYSAVTKLIWFLRPEGWTVYDSYASRALTTAGGGGAKRLFEFYNELEISFDEVASRIMPHVEKFEPRIRAERIVDQYLVLRGMEPSKRLSRLQAIEDWLTCLPTSLSTSIRKHNKVAISNLRGSIPHRHERLRRLRDQS